MLPRVTKGRIGLFGIFSLTFLPIVLWLGMQPISFRFVDTFSSLTSTGQVSALLGIVLLSLTLILSARLHFLEDYFGGLDRIYHIHHITGTLAFVLLLIHPMVLAVRLVPLSVVEAAKTLLPGGDWAINFGILSLLFMMSILIVTFLARWRYQNLRFVHQLLGGAFFLGALHAFLIPSDIAQNLTLRYYVLGLSGIALVAYLYRTVLGRVLVSKYTYTVTAVRSLGQGITEVTMKPDQKKMHYSAGQFLFVSFKASEVSPEVHPFSISSAPTEEVLRISVKALGDWTDELKLLPVGAEAKLEGPFGGFSYERAHHKKQIWIAGGIGITPFLSMARHLLVNRRPDLVVDFYYATRNKEEMVFLSELEKISEGCPNIRIIPHASVEQGFLSAEVVEKQSGQLNEKDIFVCGPPPMMQSLTSQFASAGVPKHLIHTEEFKLL